MDESIAHTISSKGNNSNGLRSNENLQCASPMARTMYDNTRVLLPSIQCENLTEEMTRRWQQKIDHMLPGIDLQDIALQRHATKPVKR